MEVDQITLDVVNRAASAIRDAWCQAYAKGHGLNTELEVKLWDAYRLVVEAQKEITHIALLQNPPNGDAS